MIVSFPKKEEPYLEGEAICTSCKYKWEAVAPVGTKELECPSCHTMKGLFFRPIIPNTEMWECNCGCGIFYVLKIGIQCYECGTVQHFPEFT